MTLYVCRHESARCGIDVSTATQLSELGAMALGDLLEELVAQGLGAYARRGYRWVRRLGPVPRFELGVLAGQGGEEGAAVGDDAEAGRCLVDELAGSLPLELVQPAATDVGIDLLHLADLRG